MATVSDQAEPASKDQVKTGYMKYGPGSLMAKKTGAYAYRESVLQRSST